MDRWLGKTAVVTGAASGIGEAITRALLRNGVNVAALDIQKERLVKLDAEVKRRDFPGVLHPILCDVTREEEINDAFKRIETLGGVDIMVNNAGVISSSFVIDGDRKAFERLLNINVLAYAVCLSKAVRSMRDRNVEGHVFNINSIAGHINMSKLNMDGSVGWNLYPVSKYATVALTFEVQRELAYIKAPIRVTGISPSFVKTNIIKDIEVMKDFFEKTLSLQPDDIANALIYALGLRPEVQISELIIERIERT